VKETFLTRKFGCPPAAPVLCLRHFSYCCTNKLTTPFIHDICSADIGQSIMVAQRKFQGN
jgi:hypothetical protein